MKVYEFKGFPNPARVRIALGEKGLFDKVEFVHVDLPGGEHKKPAYRRINPNGLVPALELKDGTIFTECSAITEYLDHLDGDPALTGRNPKERAIIAMMQRRAEAGLLDSVGAYFHHATPGLGPDVEEYQNNDWGLWNRDRAITAMRYLDKVLSERNYLAGQRFTVADITAIAGLLFADVAQIEIPQECANLKTWRERVSTRPSLANAA